MLRITINTKVSSNADAVAEYTEQAHQYANDSLESSINAQSFAESAELSAQTATSKAKEASNSENSAFESANLAQSYAVGGTGTRLLEDTDNAKYYSEQAYDSAQNANLSATTATEKANEIISYAESSEQNAYDASSSSELAKVYAQESSEQADRAKEAANRAEALVDVDIATTEKAGIVKPDGDTITIDADGTIHSSVSDYNEILNKPKINSIELSGNKTSDDLELLGNNGDGKDVIATFEEASDRINIESGEKLSVIFGKIKKFFTDLKTVAFSGKYSDLSDKPLDIIGDGLSVSLIGELSVDYDKVQHAEVGKGLSTNDYTTTEKNKLGGIEENANNYHLPNASEDTLGGIKPDGNTINVDENGIASVIGGSGSDIDILETKEEMYANTLPGKVVDALVVKDMASSSPDWQYDDTGKIIGYKTEVGADTVFPFKKGVDKTVFVYSSDSSGNIAVPISDWRYVKYTAYGYGATQALLYGMDSDGNNRDFICYPSINTLIDLNQYNYENFLFVSVGGKVTLYSWECTDLI